MLRASASEINRQTGGPFLTVQSGAGFRNILKPVGLHVIKTSKPIGILMNDDKTGQFRGMGKKSRRPTSKLARLSLLM